MKKITVVAFLCLFASCDGPTPAPTPTIQPPSVPAPEPEPAPEPLEYVARPAVARAILSVTNERRDRGGTCGGERMPAAGSLTWDDRLARAAERHALDRAEHDDLGHTGADGSSPTDRARAAGYPGVVGENASHGIYPGEVDALAEAREQVEVWIWSERHCRNLFNPRWRDMGAGYVEVLGGEPDAVVWRTHAIQVLGR